MTLSRMDAVRKRVETPWAWNRAMTLPMIRAPALLE